MHRPMWGRGSVLVEIVADIDIAFQIGSDVPLSSLVYGRKCGNILLTTVKSRRVHIRWIWLTCNFPWVRMDYTFSTHVVWDI